MSSHPYVMDDPRLTEASGGSADHLRGYPWMRHIPPPPAEGRVTPPKPMKPWVGQDPTTTATTTTSATTHTPGGGRSDEVIVIPRPFAFNTDVRKEELLNPYKDQTDNKPETSPDSADHPSANTAFDKGFVRELEKIDGITVKCGSGGSGGGGGSGGSGGPGSGGSSGAGSGAGASIIACIGNGSGLKPRINCEFCEQTFSRREGLKRHEITAHTDIRNFKCTECPQTFARKDKLKRHVETVHMTEKRFECETCGKGFNRKDKLQKHLHSDKAHGPHVMAPMKPNTLNKATQEPPLTPETENNLRKDFEAHKKLEEEERKKQQQHQQHQQQHQQQQTVTAATAGGSATQQQSSQTSTSSSTTSSTTPHHHQHHHHHPPHHHQHLPHQMNEYSDSARAFLETLSQRLNTDLPVFP